ncbi:MAG: aminodeoxychorismate synthase component I [Pseudomonadota bacterium]
MATELTAITGRLIGIDSEDFELEHPFLEAAGHFTGETGTVVLMSGGDLDCARHHILGLRPWLTLRGGRKCQNLTIRGRHLSLTADPFDTLGRILETYRMTGAELPAPIAAGLMGYFSYDLKDCLEDLPRTTLDDLHLPHICLYAPSVVIVHDIRESKTRMLRPRFDTDDDDAVRAEMAAVRDRLTSPPPAPGGFSGDRRGFRSNFERGDYLDAVRRIREYIASGHVYQVNMSQRFQMDFSGDPWALFAALYRKNPAPFFAYVNAGDHHIVSTSPERFIQREGERVETRPIKGTRPRGETAASDAALREELAASKKDDAELSMIVDLLRNDIGKVCVGGSVRVAEHKRVEAYKNVWHLVSVVEGRRDPQYDSVDILRATFPGGSITGCPKVRSMEIIDEMEPTRRHIYTGAIGYVSFHDTMDLSIAIRTATISHDRITFSVGGGIVFDSDPADEFDETLHKGRTLMEVFGGHAGAEPAAGAWAWDSGIFKPADTAAVLISDLGLQYGHGFFETIRVERGRIRHLGDHLQRFYAAWQALFPSPLPDVTWEDIIGEVVQRNGLADTVAAVKLLATRGSRSCAPFDHRIIVTARAYRHRLETTPLKGLRLALYPEPRQTPLANHKTLNYLYYHLAGQWAAANEADEAVILNPGGTVSETNTGNILIVRGRRIIRPASAAVLPGIMEKIACDHLLSKGMAVETRPVMPEDLFEADGVFVTNALMGPVPALSLGGQRLRVSESIGHWMLINAEAGGRV